MGTPLACEAGFLLYQRPPSASTIFGKTASVVALGGIACRRLTFGKGTAMPQLMWAVELPRLDENQTEATLQEWRVAEGDAVSAGRPLCLLVTAKASGELPAPHAGIVRRLLAAPKSTLPVGFILCALGEPNEPVPEEYERRNEALLAAHRAATTGETHPGSAAAGAVAAVPPPGVLGTSAAGGATPLRATPAARRLAKEHGVALEKIRAAEPSADPVAEKHVRAFLDRGRK